MSDRYLIVSTDNHAGPSLRHQLRGYCPARYLREFDEYAALVTERRQQVATRAAQSFPGMAGDTADGVPAIAAAAYARCKASPGQQDPHARLRDMDAEGVAAEVVFAGGQNDEQLPFVGFGIDGGPTTASMELLGVGCRIWNHWLADFISVEPSRHVGVMQVPIYDVATAVREVEWGRSRGLGAVNLPAPRPDFPPYTDAIYEPFWAACASLGVILGCHSGGGDSPLGTAGAATRPSNCSSPSSGWTGCHTT
jgi:predicted TIM-barrel fold metal-dependent hydrolase